VEIYFTGPKRTFGEVIKANRPDYIVQEIAMKVQYYNILKEMTMLIELYDTLDCICLVLYILH